MICHVCNSEIEDDAIVCPYCRSGILYDKQEKRYEEALERSSSVLTLGFKSRIFVVLTAALAIYALLSGVLTLVSFKNGIFEVIGNAVFYLIPGIFAGVSAYGAWKLFSAKEKPRGQDADMLWRYSKVAGGYKLAYSIITIIFSVLLIFVAIMAVVAINSIGNVESLLDESLIYVEDVSAEDAEGVAKVVGWIMSAGGALIVGVLTIVCLCAIAVSVLLTLAFRKMKKYYIMIAESVKGCRFDTKMKSPKTLLYIAGIFELISGAVNQNVILMLMSFALGAHLVLTAIFFKKLQEEQIPAVLEIEKEDAALAEARIKTVETLRKINAQIITAEEKNEQTDE